MQKLFVKNDNSFICVNCGKEVSPLGYSSRNHCPYCLCSLHVDINPGDRASDCGGMLVPIQVIPDSKKGYIVIHKCVKCNSIRRNKSAKDDDTDLLIKLTNPENGWK
jgi:DNA-directed RNA polymerase subunit RPC12/RpoP